MLVSKLEQGVIKRVISAREDAGLSRKQVAQALSLEEQSYGNYERGRTPFTVEQLLALSRVLHRPVTWLLGLPGALANDEEELLQLWRSIDDPTIKRIVARMLKDALRVERE